MPALSLALAHSFSNTSEALQRAGVYPNLAQCTLFMQSNHLAQNHKLTWSIWQSQSQSVRQAGSSFNQSRADSEVTQPHSQKAHAGFVTSMCTSYAGWHLGDDERHKSIRFQRLRCTGIHNQRDCTHSRELHHQISRSRSPMFDSELRQPALWH